MQGVLITTGARPIGWKLMHGCALPADRLEAIVYAAKIRSLEPLIADRSIGFINGGIPKAWMVENCGYRTAV